MNYENIIELLLLEFPDIKDKLETEDYLSDLPHCIFEITLIPFVKSKCKNSEEKELLKLGVFLEKMSMCEDMKVRELMNVSFLEPIVLDDKEVLSVLKNYLGEKTLMELDYWENRYR